MKKHDAGDRGILERIVGVFDISVEGYDVSGYGIPESTYVKDGGQGAIRTRGLCLAKAAIYRADLLAH